MGRQEGRLDADLGQRDRTGKLQVRFKRMITFDPRTKTITL